MPNSGRPREVPPVTRGHQTPPEPLTPATVALNIASHRDELARVNQAAIELSALCVFAFHEEIRGSLSLALQSRSGSYAREQGTGKRSLTMEDICELVTAGGAEGRNAVRALLGPIVSRLDGFVSDMDLNEAGADFARESGDVTDAILRGKTDTEIRREIREAEDQLKVLRAAVTAREDVTRELSRVCGGGK